VDEPVGEVTRLGGSLLGCPRGAQRVAVDGNAGRRDGPTPAPLVGGEEAESLNLKGGVFPVFVELVLGHPRRAPASGPGASPWGPGPPPGGSLAQGSPGLVEDPSGRTLDGTRLGPRRPGRRAPRGASTDQKGGHKGVQKGLRLHEPDEYLEPKWLRYLLPRVVTCISSGQPLDRPLAKS
jgi:hypothetical protein